MCVRLLIVSIVYKKIRPCCVSLIFRYLNIFFLSSWLLETVTMNEWMNEEFSFDFLKVSSIEEEKPEKKKEIEVWLLPCSIDRVFSLSRSRRLSVERVNLRINVPKSTTKTSLERNRRDWLIWTNFITNAWNNNLQKKTLQGAMYVWTDRQSQVERTVHSLSHSHFLIYSFSFSTCSSTFVRDTMFIFSCVLSLSLSLTARTYIEQHRQTYAAIYSQMRLAPSSSSSSFSPPSQIIIISIKEHTHEERERKERMSP